MKLTPEDIERLRTKEVANAIRKLHAGKTLTASERTLIALAGANAPADQTPGNFAKTWDDLAKALGVSRKAIQNWRDKAQFPQLVGELPEARADGRHNVAAWLNLMVRHGLKRADQHVTNDPSNADDDEKGDFIQPPRIGGTQADWNKAATQVVYEKKRDELQTFRGTLLVASELEVPLGATFAAIQTKLSQFPARVARFVKGRRDEEEIETILREEIDADLADLNAARFIETAVEEIALPFDEESTRLLQLVSFDGQDQVALRQLIARVAIEALRTIGNRALKKTLRENEIPDTAIADEKTGQVSDEAAERESKHRANISGEGASTASASQSPQRSSAKERRRLSKKKARPQPATPPAEIEAAIHPEPRRKKKRARRR